MKEEAKQVLCAICHRPLGIKGGSPAVRQGDGLVHKDCRKR